jgi:hypothetical protein
MAQLAAGLPSSPRSTHDCCVLIRDRNAEEREALNSGLDDSQALNETGTLSNRFLRGIAISSFLPAPLSECPIP